MGVLFEPSDFAVRHSFNPQGFFLLKQKDELHEFADCFFSFLVLADLSFCYSWIGLRNDSPPIYSMCCRHRPNHSQSNVEIW
jgi:hypothetical protein